MSTTEDFLNAVEEISFGYSNELNRGGDLKSFRQTGLLDVMSPILEELLEDGADVNAVYNNYEGFQLRPLGALLEIPEMVKLFLEYGADPNIPIFNNEYAIHKAIFIFFEPIEVLSLLLEYGADINHVDLYGNTPLISVLKELASTRNPDELGLTKVAEFLIDSGADLRLNDETNTIDLINKIVRSETKYVLKHKIATG